jgi:hypothetical protein
MKYDRDLFSKLSKWDIGYIYIVKSQGFFKLGTSKMPEQRIGLIKTDNPHTVEVVYLKKIVESYDNEALAHGFLKQSGLHVHGEWYRDEGDVIEVVIEMFETLMDHNREEIEKEGLTDIIYSS